MFYFFLVVSDKKIIIKNMANPEGAKAWEPYQNFDGGRFLPGINLVLAWSYL